MKRLSVDWSDLEAAFENSFFEHHYYFDRETGQVIMVSDDTYRQLEAIYEDVDDPDSDQVVDLKELLSKTDLSDWEQAAILEADHVETHWGSRIVEIPQVESYEAYGEMEEFIDTVQALRLRQQLQQAIQGRGAFGRFRQVLGNHLIEQERWYIFRQNRRRKEILRWLAEQGIAPVDVPPPAKVDMAEILEQRRQLLAEVLLFTQAAIRLPGIVRIALIGSLTTDKPDPKDADLLVTVMDDADLTQLATLGRKLQGHAQSFNRGGEVFLADPQHRYLGRTCPWKQCGLGIRASCDVLHCGQRPFLHDDLEDIQLDKSLIAQPPMVLWPKFVTHVPIPDDLAEIVIRPLQQDIEQRQGKSI
jgi:hypothetical protein